MEGPPPLNTIVTINNQKYQTVPKPGTESLIDIDTNEWLLDNIMHFDFLTQRWSARLDKYDDIVLLQQYFDLLPFDGTEPPILYIPFDEEFSVSRSMRIWHIHKDVANLIGIDQTEPYCSYKLTINSDQPFTFGRLATSENTFYNYIVQIGEWQITAWGDVEDEFILVHPSIIYDAWPIGFYIDILIETEDCINLHSDLLRRIPWFEIFRIQKIV